jgi:hypothetical protein
VIHTLELIRQLSHEQLILLLESFELSHRVLDLNSTRPVVYRRNFHIGFKQIVIFRRGTLPDFEFYAVIRMEPQMILERHRTINLFRATDYNVQALQNTFREVMSRFLVYDDGILANLSEWNCRRIDYSLNIYFDTETDLNLFLEMSKKTSRYIRKTFKRLYNIPLNQQSTAESNQSVKVMFYHKRRQVQCVYNSIPAEERRRLIEASNLLVRFEVQCKSSKTHTLKRKYGFDNRCILNYLNEDIATEMLLTEYLNSVGSGDFYSRYHAEKIIKQSRFCKSKKTRLLHFLMLISRARHISKAEEQFISGTYIRHNHNNVLVKGSKNTFRNYRKALESLAINPMLIPKERHITYLCNPIFQIERCHSN